MRTTLDLPDELFRQLKARAALTGTTVKELLASYVENGLRQGARPRTRRRRSALPVIARRRNVVGNVTAAVVARLDDQDDRAKLRRSFGR